MNKLNKILLIIFFTSFLFLIILLFPIRLVSDISSWRVLFYCISIISILIYLIIRIINNKYTGFKRLSIILAIIGFIVGWRISALSGMGIAGIALFSPIGIITGMLIVEVIIWVRKGFK